MIKNESGLLQKHMLQEVKQLSNQQETTIAPYEKFPINVGTMKRDNYSILKLVRWKKLPLKVKLFQ